MDSDRAQYRGAAAQALPRRSRTYPKGRVCAEEGCTTILSVYNRSEFCWQHEPAEPNDPRDSGRRKRAAA